MKTAKGPTLPRPKKAQTAQGPKRQPGRPRKSDSPMVAAPVPAKEPVESRLAETVLGFVVSQLGRMTDEARERSERQDREAAAMNERWVKLLEATNEANAKATHRQTEMLFKVMDRLSSLQDKIAETLFQKIDQKPVEEHQQAPPESAWRPSAEELDAFLLSKHLDAKADSTSEIPRAQVIHQARTSTRKAAA